MMKKAEEELCLQMLTRPDFVENLNILRQGSGSTNTTHAVGEAPHLQMEREIHSSNHVSSEMK